jgi:hypothetical protein
MVAQIPGGDDGNRQNLGVRDVHPHITAMPQAFHQRVNHDKSGYDVASDRRLLLAMMLVWQPRSCQRCRWSSTSNQSRYTLSDPHYCRHAKNSHHKRFPFRASLARSNCIFVAANDCKRVASDLYWTTQWVLVQRPGGQTAPGAEPAAEQTQQQRAGLSRCRA